MCMSANDRIKIITTAIKIWSDERDFFAAAVRCATTPQQLEEIIYDERWAARRKKAEGQFNKSIQEVINRG